MRQNSGAWLLMAFVIAVAVAYAQNAKAETYLYAGAWSDHPFSDEDYNESHRLAAIEYSSVVAGYFRNSYGEDSFITGYRFKRSVGHWEGSLLVGATWGYRHCFKGYADRDKRFCPVAVPMVAYTKYRLQPGVMILGNAVAVTARVEL